ncbi:hypothetical protein [Microcystis aeruginosa]|uniref:Uncharacterized protein n=1 Tax=Microcystis aeruginosa FD4 TaxID=2686288 RepID=A0A857D0V7_MICAE|nr:hypothetical protein [Microcystis aeruginosa]QGZ89262.1 hypothetical protein GQR42_06380 [Microcystis aeruginosa FD4]
MLIFNSKAVVERRGFRPKIFDENFPEAWRRALANVRGEYKAVSFPEEWPYGRDWQTILKTDFWE